MPGRYVVTHLPGSDANSDYLRWVILDKHLWGYCTLLGEGDNLLPLEWGSSTAAEAWLKTCHRLWAAGMVPAPDDWRPFRADVSPWLRP